MITVNSINDLKSTPIPSDNSAKVYWYSRQGDNGGGDFYWDSTDLTSAENGGTIFVSTVTVNGRWKRSFNGPVFIDWFGADPTGTTPSPTIPGSDAAMTNAIAYLKSIGGGKLILSGHYKFTNDLVLENLNGISIEGNCRNDSSTGAMDRSVLDFSYATTNTDSLVIKGFVKIAIRDLNILNNRTNESTKILELYNGNGFEIDNISIRSGLGSGGRPFSLGKSHDEVTALKKSGAITSAGEVAAFMGSISNIDIYQEGGTGMLTGMADTSLNVRAVYLRQCGYVIDGTVYSTFISCGVDGSHGDGYLISGNDDSNANSLTLISCGAENSFKSAFKIEDGAINVKIINPHSATNNTSKNGAIGSLLTIEKKGTGGLISDTTIESPTDTVPTTGTNYSIYGGPNSGDLHVNAMFAYAQGITPIGGDPLWLKTSVFFSAAGRLEVPQLTVKNNGISLIKEGHTFLSASRYATTTITSPANYIYLYPGSGSNEGLITPYSNIRAIVLEILTDITSGDGGTAFDLLIGDGIGTGASYLVESSISLTNGTKVKKIYNNLPPVTQTSLGLMLQMQNAKSFSSGSVKVTVFAESLS